MSLILEALKKLDREKQAPDRGFLVVGTTAWSSGEGRGSRALVALLALALAAGLAGLYAWVAHAPTARPAQTSLATAPSGSPAATPTFAPTAGPAVLKPPPPEPEMPRSLVAAPARPAPAPSGQPRALVLTAISQKDGHPIAVLNDRFVREGDSFDGVRIVRIGETEVEVEVDGRRLVVTF